MPMTADRRQTLITRLIAIDRGVHALVFTVAAVALAVLTIRLPRYQGVARELLPVAQATLATEPGPGRRLLVDALRHVVGLHRHTLVLLLLTAIGYAIVEAVEAVGLWRRRRWAEYLTVVATAGLLPFELAELAKQVTPVRVGALVINLAVVAYLVWATRLFGLRGGAAAQGPGPDEPGNQHPSRPHPPNSTARNPHGDRGRAPHAPPHNRFRNKLVRIKPR